MTARLLPFLPLYFLSEAAKPRTAQRVGFGPQQLGHTKLFEPLSGKHRASLRVAAPTNLTLILTLAHERAKGLVTAARILLSCPLGDAEAHPLPLVCVAAAPCLGGVGSGALVRILNPIPLYPHFL